MYVGGDAFKAEAGTASFSRNSRRTRCDAGTRRGHWVCGVPKPCAPRALLMFRSRRSQSQIATAGSPGNDQASIVSDIESDQQKSFRGESSETEQS